jgi:hypothetical protein
MGSGHFKAYRMEESPLFSTPRLELLEQWDTAVSRRISDQMTDKSGQFGKGSLSFSAVNDMANGERHNLELELRRRALKQMTTRMSELLEIEAVDSCYIAAARKINQTVLDILAAPIRKRIEKNLAVNLTRLNSSEIVRHLSAAPSGASRNSARRLRLRKSPPN